jgi:hypothetical protein
MLPYRGLGLSSQLQVQQIEQQRLQQQLQQMPQRH